jgi:Double-GTPase 2
MSEAPRESRPASGPPPAPTTALVTSSDAMTLEHARALSGRRGARLVLVMGESATGKTSLLAALWQRMLESGQLAGHNLAGSRTALGFERRAHWQRLDSGQDRARTPPSAPAEALLHLRMRRPDGTLVELLISDLAGEQFERVREGRPLLAELPWAARADRAVVLVDGAALAVPGESEIAVTRAERLVLALQTSGAVRETARIALVLTKSDALGVSGEQALARHEKPLAEIARRLDPEATWIRTTALGAATDGDGLGAFLTWLCAKDRPRSAVSSAEAPSLRTIERFQA